MNAPSMNVCATGLRCTVLPPVITCRCVSSSWNPAQPCLPPRTATCRRLQISVRRWRRATPSARSSSMVCMLISLHNQSDLYSCQFVSLGIDCCCYYGSTAMFRIHTVMICQSVSDPVLCPFPQECRRKWAS